MIVALLVLGIVGIVALRRTAQPTVTPWCEAEHRSYRCHLPRGHSGPHWCDDWTGDFAWSFDS